MADRYWVGGTGTWNTTSTTNWSATSGGPNGASVPTTSDNVFFDGASAAGNYTVSTSTGLALACLNLTIAKATAGNVTFIDTGTFAVAGNLDITATGVTWSAFGTWTFTSTGARTIKTDGIVLPGVTINGTGGGSWQLLSDLSTSLTGSLTLTAGTLNLNNFNTYGFLTRVIEDVNNVQKTTFLDCKKRFIVYPVVSFMFGLNPSYNFDYGAHACFCIYDNNSQKAYFFDPHQFELVKYEEGLPKIDQINRIKIVKYKVLNVLKTINPFLRIKDVEYVDTTAPQIKAYSAADTIDLASGQTDWSAGAATLVVTYL
jgi:hypothetical protein